MSKKLLLNTNESIEVAENKCFNSKELISVLEKYKDYNISISGISNFGIYINTDLKEILLDDSRYLSEIASEKSLDISDDELDKFFN